MRKQNRNQFIIVCSAVVLIAFALTAKKVDSEAVSPKKNRNLASRSGSARPLIKEDARTYVVSKDTDIVVGKVSSKTSRDEGIFGSKNPDFSLPGAPARMYFGENEGEVLSTSEKETQATENDQEPNDRFFWRKQEAASVPENKPSSADSDRFIFFKEKKEPAPPTEEKATATESNPEPAAPLKHEYPYPVPQRLSARDTQQKGIGYSAGYFTLDGLFGPDYVPGELLPLVDIRGHRLDNNTYAANAGIVGRYLPETNCVMYGLNAYYDYRQGCFTNHHQLGLGMEILSKRWDLRFNGYIPFGKKKFVDECKFSDCTGLFAIFRKKEFVFQGFNAELGGLPVKSGNFLLYAAAGPYYLSSKHKDAWGIRGRIRPQYSDWAALEFSVSHDNVFKTIYQGQLIFSVPLYKFYSRKTPRHHPCLTDRQIYQPVERFEIIPIKCVCEGWITNF